LILEHQQQRGTQQSRTPSAPEAAGSALHPYSTRQTWPTYGESIQFEDKEQFCWPKIPNDTCATRDICKLSCNCNIALQYEHFIKANAHTRFQLLKYFAQVKKLHG